MSSVSFRVFRGKSFSGSVSRLGRASARLTVFRNLLIVEKPQMTTEVNLTTDGPVARVKLSGEKGIQLLGAATRERLHVVL